MPSPEQRLADAEQIVKDHRKHGRCGSCDGTSACWMHLWASNTVAAAQLAKPSPKPVHWRYDGPTPSGASPWESRSG